MAILWTPELAVGVAEIDDAHQELFRRINTLLEAMEASSGAAAVVPLFQFLTDYVRSHFGDEERLMRACRYPGLLAHESEHAYFVEAVKQLVADYQRQGTGASITIRLTNLLCEWLRDHIARTDKALGDHLASPARSLGPAGSGRR